MPSPTLYREDDPISARWAGLGRRLTKYEMDLNHYQFDTRIGTLEANYAATVSLATITQPTPSSLLFTLTDMTTQGPFDIPVSTFRDRGDWAIDTPYLVNDTFNAADGGLYRVTFDHTSSHTSFDPAANDGMGHDFYASMIPPRGNTIPSGGAVGMYFRKNSVVDYVANWAFIRAIEVTFAASTDSTLVSTTVADALEELEARITLDAVSITYEPSTGIWLTSDNVRDALEELANIDASHVVYAPTGDLVSTNVADALGELEGLIGGVGGAPAVDGGFEAAPAGNVSTTEKAMGLGGGSSAFTHTPISSGILLVWIGGVALNSTAAGDGVTITGRYGTGTAPVNGATTGLGTQFSIPQHVVASTTLGQQGFIVLGKVVGLDIGTTYWFDLSIVAVTAGGATVKDVQFAAIEGS